MPNLVILVEAQDELTEDGITKAVNYQVWHQSLTRILGLRDT